MKKRLLSLLLTACMVLGLLPTMAFAEAAPQGTETTPQAAQREIDQQTYDTLGLNLDDSKKLAGSPYGGNGKEGETTQLGVQKELYSYGSFNNTLANNSNQTSIAGSLLRNNAVGIKFGDADQGGGIQTKSYKEYFFTGSGTGAKTIDSATSVLGTYNDSDASVRYATVEAFDAGDGKDNYVAQLRYIVGDAADLTVYAIGETGVRTVKKTIELPSVATVRKSTPVNSTAMGDEVYSALFELTAGDFDGDGVDELALSYPRGSADDAILVYEFDRAESKLTQKISLSVGAHAMGVAANHATIALSSGSLKRNGRDQLFVSVSDNTNGGASRLVIFDNGKQDYAFGDLGMQYSATALGNLENATVSGEATLVVGGYIAGATAKETVTAYRLLRYDNGYSMNKVTTQKAPFDDAGTRTYTYSVGNDERYHAPVAVSCAALKGHYAASQSRDYVLLGTAVYYLGGGDSLQTTSLEINGAPSDAYSYLSIPMHAGAIWIDEVVAANLTGDPKGCEQFAAVVASAEHTTDLGESTGGYASYRGLALSTYAWYYADRAVMPDSVKTDEAWYNLFVSSSDFLVYEDYATQWKLDTSGKVPEDKPSPTYTDSFYALCAPDVDNDSSMLTLKKSSKVYTDPEVIAILQSSPYFEDIAQSFPGEYPNQAATEWGQSKSTGTGTSAATNWSAGAYVSVDVSFAVANEEEVEASYTGSKEISDSTTISEEFAYQTTAGEDSVVVICVPYMIYEYEVKNKDNSVGQIISYYPMPVVEHQITVEQYDAIAAITEGLEPIRGNVLTSTPGDPASYDNWPAGSTDIQTPSESGHAAATSTNFNETISGTVETEHEESRTNGFEINTKVGLGGGFAGNNVMAGVVAGGGNEWTSATVSSKGTSFAGTVDALPEEAAQYSFNWQISRREATLNGNPVQMVCYKTSAVTEGVGVPRELSVDEVTKNTMTISWEQVAEALQYNVYEKTTSGYLRVATVANVANANSDRQSLTLTNLTVNRAYTYKIAAISADGNGEGLKSDEVAGTTLPGDGTLSVTEQPKDQTKIPGDMAEFKAAGTYLNAAEESLELAYSWCQRAKGASAWSSIRGANSATYSVAAEESMDGNEYCCLIYPVSNASNVIKTNVATLHIGKATSTTTLGGTPTAETVLTTDGTSKPTNQPIALYSGGVTYTKMKVGATGSVYVWSGSDGKYYTHTADDTVPTAAIGAEANMLRIGGQDFDTAGWANETSRVSGGITITKDKYGRYTNEGGTPVAAYTIYQVSGTKFISTNLKPVTKQVMTVQGGSTGTAVTLTATVDAASANPYGKVTFTMTAPGVATETISKPATSGTATATWMPTTPGLYTVTAQYEGDDRHVSSISAPLTYLVVSETTNSKLLTLNVGASTATYGDSIALNPTLTTTTVSSGTVSTTQSTPTVTYTVLQDGVKLADSATVINANNTFTPKQAGSYTITASHTVGGVTYNVVTTITVNKAPLTIKAKSENLTLNETHPALSATVTGLKPGDKCTLDTHFTLTSDGYAAATTGNFPVRVNMTEDGEKLRQNYTVLTEDGVYALRGVGHKLTVTSGDNGTAKITYTVGTGTTSYTANSGDSIPEGANVTITALPARGYQVKQWTNNGTVVNENNILKTTNPLVIKNYSQATTVHVDFTQKYSTLTFEPADNVKAVYLENNVPLTTVFNSGDKLSEMQSVRLTATPPAGKAISEWKITTGTGETAVTTTVKAADGKSAYTGATYDVSKLTEDTKVNVVFAPSASHSLVIKPVDSAGAAQSNVSVSVVSGDKSQTLTKAENGSYCYTAATGENPAITLTLPASLMVESWKIGDQTITESLSNANRTLKLYNVTEGVEYTIKCVALNSYSVTFGGTLTDGEFADTVGTVEAFKVGAIGTSLTSGALQLQASTINFVATPKPGYEIEGWNITHGGQMVDKPEITTKENKQTFQIASLSGAAAVTVNFRKQPIITGIGDVSGGTVSATLDGKTLNNNDPVPYGSKVVVTLTPEKGYEVGEMTTQAPTYTDTNGATTDAKTYTLRNVTTDTKLAADFIAIEPKLSVSYGALDKLPDAESAGYDGTVSVAVERKGMESYKQDAVGTDVANTINDVYRDSTVTFTATPDSGYKLSEYIVTLGDEPLASDKYTVDGNQLTLTVDNAYTNGAVLSVTARFELIGTKITYAVEGEQHATISAISSIDGKPFATDSILIVDSTLTFTASPETGYVVEGWYVDEVKQPNETGETFTYAGKKGLGADIKVKIIRESYTVTYGAEHGTVTAKIEESAIDASPATVVGDSEVTFTTSPDASYQFVKWIVNGEDVADATLTRSITEDLTVQAVFELIVADYTVTFSAAENGSVTAENGFLSGNPIAANTTLTLTAAPVDGYQVEGWYVGGSKVADSAEKLTYTTEPVAAELNITVKFGPIPRYAVQLNGVTNGSVAVTVNGVAAELTDGALSVKRHDKLVFTATPNSYHYVESFTGSPALGTKDGNVYTVEDVTEDFTVTVKFSPTQMAKLTANVLSSTAGGTLAVKAGYGEALESIDASSGVTLTLGTKIVLTASPETGYMVKEWKVNGNVVDNLSNTLTIESFQQATTVTVEFETPDTMHEIPEAKDYTGYTISNLIKTPADYGTDTQIRARGTVQFTVTPAAGSYLTKLVFGGVDLKEPQTTGNCTLAASVTSVRNADGSYTLTFTGVKGAIDTTGIEAIKFKIEAGGEIELPAGMPEDKNTVEEVKAALKLDVTSTGSIPESNIELYDVTLRVSSDGTNWEDATESNFPVGGVTITLPYPIGVTYTTASDYTLVVTHMFTSTAGGKTPGDIETFTVANGGLTLTEDGMQMTVTSLSPFAVGYVKKATPPDPDGDGSGGGGGGDDGSGGGAGGGAGGGGGGGGAGGGAAAVSTVSVIFHTNGGNELASQSVASGKTITKPTDPEKKWYVFAGWYTDKELTAQFDFSTKITKDMTLFAKWAPHKCLSITDITNHWARESICFMVENGYMAGTSTQHFEPDSNLSRAMIVTILHRIEGLPTAKGMQFADVAPESWCADAISWANANGIVFGYSNGNFGSNDSVTREQLVSILYRYAQLKKYDITKGGMAVREFSDYESISGYATEAMAWAVNAGLISGVGNNMLNPRGTASRAQVATILTRFENLFDVK